MAPRREPSCGACHYLRQSRLSCPRNTAGRFPSPPTTPCAARHPDPVSPCIERPPFSYALVRYPGNARTRPSIPSASCSFLFPFLPISAPAYPAIFERTSDGGIVRYPLPGGTNPPATGSGGTVVPPRTAIQRTVVSQHFLGFPFHQRPSNHFI